MTQDEIINEVKTRLVDTYDPIAIYIFGSYAWGVPTPDSDLDVAIVVESSDEKSYKRPIPGYQALFGLGLSKDLIVYTKEEFEACAKQVTSLCYKIKKEGKLLYARS